MKTLRLVLGDQASLDVSSLRGADPDRDIILMCEVMDEALYVKHHKMKIAFVFSVMRHFAEALRKRGYRVDYVALEDRGNTGNLVLEAERALARHDAAHLVLTEPGEYRLRAAFLAFREAADALVEVREDDRFLCSHDAFDTWAGRRRQYRMEYFYREMRRKTGLLMDGDDPAGGQWNFDEDNRKVLPSDLVIPARPAFPPDDITQAVLDLVERRFADHFGALRPFNLPVTAEDAQEAADFFVAECLPLYGDYQDAMKAGEPFLFHAHISAALNVGLLDPLALCRKAEAAWRKGEAPLNAVEGFIRQIIGWREYVRGIYWREMPGYKATNALSATRPLPDFYWTGETDMNCLAQAVGDTKQHAYAHHIQRLMVTGNFALLAGLDPDDVNDWYMVVYADAYEWVELPNTHGMALFADGGVMASKPYAASGAYIDRMSDYCTGCRHSPKVKTGEGACPFNLLYWDFMMRNRDVLGKNPRLGMIYRTLDKMMPEKRETIQAEAAAFLGSL